MRFFADLEIHSKYSRAVSKEMTLENIAKWASIKGIGLVGTGDFTHPMWFKEIREKLEEVAPGLFRLKRQYRGRDNLRLPSPLSSAASGAGFTERVSNNNHANSKAARFPTKTEPYFMLTAEISCIYSRGGRVRRVHHILIVPSLKAAQEINTRLSWQGNLKSDGRPIIGIDSQELLKIVLGAAPDALLIPAHVWTPWFGIFGSKSGFDSLQECFGDLAKHILAVETGLSSDPPMNWRLEELDRVAIVSFSDAHSPPKLGREAVVLDIEPSYEALYSVIKTKDPARFLFTLEFFPAEGKYHYDGHRDCAVRFSPQETKANNGLCPVCSKPLTVGVLNRVEELASRPVDYKPASSIPFRSLIPLDEIIAETLGVGTGTKGVMQNYFKLILEFGSEFTVLLDAARRELERAANPEIAEGILRVREGKVRIEPGYDGVFGKIKIFEEEERVHAHNQPQPVAQQSLFL